MFRIRKAGARDLMRLVALSLMFAPLAGGSAVAPTEGTISRIIQGPSASAAAAQVRAVGGTVTHELGIIDAVAADLTADQLAELRATASGLRLWHNRRAAVTGKPSDAGGKPGGGKDGGGSPGNVVETYYPTHLGADLLHDEGIDGSGVTIAILDTGIFQDTALTSDPENNDRVLVYYDSVADEFVQGSMDDDSGHGSHVASIAVSSAQTDGKFNGMAPRADLVVVDAFDANGTGTYADVIRGLDFIRSYKGTYGIRVVNCSFSATPQTFYWDDPLNQAIMSLWNAGVVVVASAGNKGPEAMTVGVPGNLPYLITVGAMTDSYTPDDMTDDILASFSAAGPTTAGFVKPEVVAPGGHVKGLMKLNSTIATEHPNLHDGGKYFNMSGTSQAAAFVTGTVALMLQASPQLTPDEVKYRLMESARPAVDLDGTLTYSVFQQGAGLINAYDAVHSTATGTANNGMDIFPDMIGIRHYGGRANRYTEGKGKDKRTVYYLMDLEGDGFLWSDGYALSNGFLWSDGFVWSDGLLWSDALLWSDGVTSWYDQNDVANDGFVWSDGFLWSDGFVWSDGLPEAMSINVWVEDEAPAP